MCPWKESHLFFGHFRVQVFLLPSPHPRCAQEINLKNETGTIFGCSFVLSFEKVCSLFSSVFYLKSRWRRRLKCRVKSAQRSGYWPHWQWLSRFLHRSSLSDLECSWMNWETNSRKSWLQSRTSPFHATSKQEPISWLQVKVFKFISFYILHEFGSKFLQI